MQSAWALDQSKTVRGANHQRAHQNPHKAMGKNIPIGVIEPGGAINPVSNLGTRLKAEWNFANVMPGSDPGNFSASGSDHTTLVANVAAGDHATHVGVAKEALIFSANAPTRNINIVKNPPATPDNGGFDEFRAAVDFMYRPRAGETGANAFKNHPRIALYNSSWAQPPESNDNGADRFPRFIDYFTTSRDSLFISAAGNCAVANANCPAGGRISRPWDAFNGITVGALAQAPDGSYVARAAFSEYWLDTDDGTKPDKRGKPDILAPGDKIGDGTLAEDSGTSFAAPHVTGVAAMLMEKGLNLPSTDLLPNHQAIKAIILNSARKRGINPPEHGIPPEVGFPDSQDNAATQGETSDKDYVVISVDPLNKIFKGDLIPGATPDAGPPGGPTAQWTPSKWKVEGGKLTAFLPLDDEQGTGALDAERALIQMDGGEQNPGPVSIIGWDRHSIVERDSTRVYAIRAQIPKHAFITATLVWDRPVIEKDLGVIECDKPDIPGPNLCGLVDQDDTYVLRDMADLNLEILYKGAVVAQSISTVDNVEHLHYPVPENGDPLDYAVRVTLKSQTPGLDFTDYGLAWWTVNVPAPGTFVLLVAALFATAPARSRKKRS
jgi:hypothetical protein